MPAFRTFDCVSTPPNRQSQGSNRRKSPATPANIPVLQRLSAETGLDHDCRPLAAVIFTLISVRSSREQGIESSDCGAPAVVEFAAVFSSGRAVLVLSVVHCRATDLAHRARE